MALLDFFPTPKFLTLPAAGLAIFGRALSFIELKKIGRQLRPGNAACLELPAEFLKDGQVGEFAGLKKLLNEFRVHHRLRFVRVALPAEKAFLFRLSLPAMSPKETRQALELKLEENVPFNSSEAVFDFCPLPPAGGQPERQLAVSVLPKSVVEQYLKLFLESGFRPLAFETEPQALTRAVVAEGDRRPYLIVNLEENRISLILAAAGLAQFASTLVGDRDFFEEKAGLNQDFPAGSQPAGAKIYQPAGRDKGLKEEIEKLLAYWESSNRSLPAAGKIEKIIVCGQQATLPKVQSYFSRYFSGLWVVADVWRNVFSLDDFVPDISSDDSLKYAAAVGLALPPVAKNYV